MLHLEEIIATHAKGMFVLIFLVVVRYKLTCNNFVRGNTANIDLSLINILKIFVELEVGTYVAVKKLHLLGII